MLEAQLTACCAKMINAGLDFTSDTLRRKSGELSEDLGEHLCCGITVIIEFLDLRNYLKFLEDFEILKLFELQN